MKRLSVWSSILITICFAAAIFLLSLDAHAGGIGDQIKITGKIDNDSLGIRMKINSYGSAIIEIANNSDENLSIGSDMFIWANTGNRFNVALMMPSYNPIPKKLLSNYVYASGVNNFSKIKDDTVLWAFGPGGDWLNLQGIKKSYKGIWPKNVLSGQKVTLKHRLATWPGANQGWLATPVFTSKKTKGFRIISQFGTAGDHEQIVVPMTAHDLLKLIHNKKFPVPVRIWAACWLTNLKDGKHWLALGDLLSDAKADMNLRKAMAKNLSTQAPAEALTLVNDALWDSSTPKELQLICFYSFTWSKHPEAKKFIAQATKHPNTKIKAEAKKYMPKNKS